MEFNEVLQAISTVGFPIAACCALFYLYNNIITSLTTTLAEIGKTLEQICCKLDVDKNHEKD